MEVTYIALLCHVRYNIILVFWVILRDGNAVTISWITKKMHIELLWRLTYMLPYLQKVLNTHNFQWWKYFYKIVLMSPLHCQTQASSENLLFTLPIINLKMFRGHISIIGASTETKPRLSVFVIYFLVFQINKVWKFILIEYGNSLYLHFNEGIPFPMTFYKLCLNLEADGDLGGPL